MRPFRTGSHLFLLDETWHINISSTNGEDFNCSITLLLSPFMLLSLEQYCLLILFCCLLVTVTLINHFTVKVRGHVGDKTCTCTKTSFWQSENLKWLDAVSMFCLKHTFIKIVACDKQEFAKTF